MTNKVTLICEIGVNHFGGFERACTMIQKAAECGADAVKFQKYNPVKVLGPNHPALNDAYQLSWKELTELSMYAHQLRLQFGCSVFDVNGIPIVDKISDFHKIASRMNQNQEFIARIDKCKKPTYISIQPDTTSQRIPDRFQLLWCIPEYPSLKSEILKYPYQGYGLSSHCPDITATLEAIRLGARVVEHHVCFSREEKGCDISSSITFDELRQLRESVYRLAKE